MIKNYPSLFIVAFLIISCLCVFPGFKVTGQSRIYGVDSPYLVYFDYVTGEYDTVVVPGLSIPSPNLSFGCSIDPYNGIYYFDANPLNQSGSVKCIDLNSLNYSSTLSFNEKNTIEYNCMDNSIVFENYSGEFYSYIFKNQTLSLLANLPSSTGMLSGEQRVYNAASDSYLFKRYTNGEEFYDLINASNGVLISSVQINEGYGIESPVADYQTGDFYGVFRDTVVKLDPFTGEMIRLIELPMPLVHLNTQMAVYDQNNKIYILPCYKNSDNEAYYIIVDLTTPEIDTVFIQPNRHMNWQRIYCKPRTRLLLIGDSILICSKGINYTWYYNDQPIWYMNSNTYMPEQSGIYKVLVRYPTYSSMSNEINYLMTNIGQLPDSSEFQIYPNPTAGSSVLTFHISQYQHVTLKVLDVQGREITTIVDETKSPGEYSVNTNLAFLEPGIYFYCLQTSNKWLTKKIIIK